jgi:hypothetical protein
LPRAAAWRVMASNDVLAAEVTPEAAAMSAVNDLRLLRRYEPVLHFTQGELFPADAG